MSRVNFGAEPAPLSVELEWVAPDIIDLQRDFHRQDVSSMRGLLACRRGADGEAAGIAVTPTVAVAYGIVAVFLYALNRYPALTGSGEVVAATLAEYAESRRPRGAVCAPVLHCGKAWLCRVRPDTTDAKSLILQ
jgi:hypothetical protein